MVYMLLVIVIAISPVFAQRATILFFWGEGCPHCAHEKPFLQELEQKYPELEVEYYETWYNPENAKLFNEVAKAYGTTARGVPTTFIGDEYWVGYADYMKPEIEKAVQECIESGCENPLDINDKKNNQEIVSEEICVHVFVQGNCSQCSSIIPFLDSIEKQDDVKIEIHDVSEEENSELYSNFKDTFMINAAGYPVAFLGEKFLIGETAIRNNLESEIAQCKELDCPCPAERVTGMTPHMPGQGDITPEKIDVVNLPIVGKIDVSNMGIFMFTILIGTLDGFNACAMWVLMFLLSMLVYTNSRKKMFLIGGTFIFISGFVYYLFMVAWMNAFIFAGHLRLIQIAIAAIAIIFGIVNIKDYFAFGKGISFTIPDDKKPGIIARMRSLLKPGTGLFLTLVGVASLAFMVNLVELLCTAGFPAVYTNVLAQQNLSTMGYYLYIGLYIMMYMIDDFIIFSIVVLTMTTKKFTEKYGRLSKLISGIVILILGLIMLINPNLLMF